ncbi:MAG: hypothetical protein ABWX73_06405 [Marmoricola sp.]
MTEPMRPGARLIRMTRTLALPLLGPALALILLAGCGSAADPGSGDAAGSGPSESPTPSASVAAEPGCTPVEGAPRIAQVLASVDLDGDGTPDPVGLTGAEDPCPGQLSAEIGDRDEFVALPADEPPVSAAFAVAIPGRTGEVLVTRQDHPRGGFQTRVFALAGDEFAQLEVEGGPLVPFVATDVQEHPVSIDCGDNVITVTEAVAHEPPGVMAAWDVRQTTYAVQGVTVTKGPTREIADNVLPRQLKQQHPELEKNAVFPSCRVPTAPKASSGGAVEPDHSDG